MLGNITKHSEDFATQVMNKIKINLLQKLLNCLKDPDDIIKKIEPYCVCEIVNKSPENANHVWEWRGPSIIVEFIIIIKCDPRLYMEFYL